MLNLFRLHAKTCSAKRPRLDRAYRRCACPIHVEGMCGTEYIRESLKTGNWQTAQTRVSEAEARNTWQAPAGEPGGPGPKPLVDASTEFMKDAEEGRRLNEVTLKKYRLLLRDLAAYARDRGFRFVKELDLPALREFRDRWSKETPATETACRRAPLGPRTAMKKLERLRAFYRFCHESGWVEKNWAKLVRGPSNIKDVQKMPFEPEEFSRIMSAARRVELKDHNNAQLEAFILLMRYSGLRISDAAMLTADRIKGQDLFLYTQKTGTHVYCPLPPMVLESLLALPLKQGKYFFVWESLNLNPLANVWRRKLEKVFAEAGIRGGHPHRLRHTFAVELLKEGVPIEDVSTLMGHSSIRVTEKHYSAWVQARQDRLRASVEKTWRPTLVQTGKKSA